MSQSSFEIKTGKDLFLKLGREHKRLLEDLWSSDHAINFSITAHHLFKDWLKRELPSEEYITLEDELKAKLGVEIEIIRDVCDGSKHLQLDRPPHKQVQRSDVQQGAFPKGFDRSFDIGGLQLTLHDGSKVYFDNVADKVLEFWRSYFNDRP